MKNFQFHKFHLSLSILFIISFSFGSCGYWTVPPELIGDWESDKHEITVRIKSDGEFQFISDTAQISIQINADNTVSGSVGAASFENGIILKNRGNPKVTGCAHVIKCDSIGKIFDRDPLENKEVQLWLAPMEDNIDAELRYTQGMAQFPMAGIIFTRKE